MAASYNVTVNVSISGLGKGTEKKNTFQGDTAPEVTCSTEQQMQETADVAEALNVGAVDTVLGVWIRAIDNDLAVDTSYAATFSAELIIPEGEAHYFKPSGTVYIKNNTALEKCTFEYLVIGVQS
jgi:hypothetical protein